MSNPLILGTNSIKDTGYEVANSLRFESAYLQNPSSGASSTAERRTLTWSFWFKRSKLGAVSSTQYVISGRYNSSYHCSILLNSTDQLRLFQNAGGSTQIDLKTNRKFRDTASWYHVVVAIDTTQSTSSNRVKIYVNGTQESSFATETYPSLNRDTYFGMTSGTDGYPTYIGSNTSEHFHGYMAEVVEVGGSQLDADSFGEFDSDTNIWIPKDLSDLSFGSTAGANVYLDFQDSSTLGNDVSGGNNDYSVNNLTSIDQTTDTCTNNFATMNPLDNYYAGSTFSEGNLKIVSGTSPYSSNTATFGLSSGKWYYELKYLAKGGSEDLWHVGIKSTQDTSNSQMLGHFANDYGYRAFNGNVRNNNADITYGNTFAVNDIIGVYIDLDNSKLYFAKNGTVQNSGTGISITSVASTPLGVYLPAISWNDGATTGTCSLNFGNPEFSITSGNSDANGYGNFEYDPSSGTFDGSSKDFLAINTKNLAEYG